MALVLMLAWGLMTAVTIMLFNRLPQRSLLAAIEWGTLYMATLVVPVLYTLRMRGRLQRLQVIHGPIPDAIAAELARAGWSYVAFGYFAAVTALGLMLFYAT
jgi:hypothetical protein